MKAHILMGCDVTSKIGTQTAAIKASPESYLHNFGEEHNPSAEAFLKAEEYLVCVLHKNSPAKSFDEFRYLWYKNKNKSLSELSPTSHLLQSHLERSFFLIRNCADLLNENADPLESGWKGKGCILLPSKYIKSVHANAHAGKMMYFILNTASVVVIVLARLKKGIQ